MADFMPPVVVDFAANVTEALAGIAEFEAALRGLEATTAQVSAASAESMAALGTATQESAVASGAAVEGAAATQAEAARASAAATSTATAEIEADQRALIESAASMAASADAAALKWADDYAKMALATNKATLDMEAAQARAAAGAEAMAVKIDAAAASTTATSAGMGVAFGKAAAGVGLAAAVIAGASLHMAGDFEQSTNKLVTSAGESHDAIGMVRDGLLSMAGDVGQSAEDLSAAMYKVESAGYHGASGLGILKAAEQGAKAEGADGAKVADALSSAMRDYYPHAQSAADVTKYSTEVMSKLIGATSAGKMTFDELSGSLNSILPVSSAANISLNDTLGVLASMTVHGISAEQATQNMADAIRHLEAPTQVMSKAMATLGIDSQDIAAKLGERGLSGTMQLLSDRVRQAMPPGSDKVIIDLGNALSQSTPKVQELGQRVLDGSISMAEFSKAAKALDPISAKQAMSFATLAGSSHQLGNEQLSGTDVMKTYSGTMQALMGDATGLKVALMTTGENAGYTSDAIKTITGSTADAAGNVKGWAEVQDTFNQKASEAKAGLGALAISIGEKLLPVASKIAGVLSDGAHWLAEHKAAADILAIAVGIGLVVAFSALLVVLWGFVGNPVTWIIAGIIVAIGLLAYGVYELVTHWSDVVDFFAGVWQHIKDAFSAAIDWIVGIFKDWYPLILGILTGGVLLLPMLIVKYWDNIVTFFKELPGKILMGMALLGQFLGRVAVDAWHAFLDACGIAFEAVLEFVKQLPYRIGFAIGFLIGLLARTARDAWNAFTNGIVEAWNATVTFFKDLPGNIADFFAGVGDWLYEKGKALLEGAKRGIDWAWDVQVKFYQDLPGNIADFFANAGDWLYDKGKAILEGAGRGISYQWDVTVQFFRDFPSNLGNFFSNAADWLFEAGKNIVQGIWNGIQALAGWLWDQCKNFAKGIINGVKAGLGIASPSKEGALVGENLALSIAGSLDQNAHVAVASASALAGRVVGAMSGLKATATLAVGGDGASAPNLFAGSAITAHRGGPNTPGGGTVIHVDVTVQGSVVSERDLVASVQKGLLRLGIRNVGSGTTYTTAGG